MPFQILRNDITKMKADAIVNTAASQPGCGRGTDSAVYKEAGFRKLLARRKEIGKIEVGEAEVTPAFSLDARYLIHTVGPRWQGGQQGEAELLKNCYKNSLNLARRYRCRSIAFPLISAGSLGFPKAEALQIAVSAIGEFLAEEEMLVYLVVFDGESFKLSGNLFRQVDSYIDDNYVTEKLEEEYNIYPEGPWNSREMPEPPGEAGAELCRTGTPVPFSAPAAAAGKGEVFRTGTPVPFSAPAAAAGKGEAFRPGAPRMVRSLEDAVAQLGETFQQQLLRLIDQRGMTDVEVYKRANLDRKLFSKIRCNVNYRPKKMTALALAVALRLNLDETRDLLARAELALSPSSKFDLILSYFIEQQVYDIYTINLALFEHEQPLLGEG